MYASLLEENRELRDSNKYLRNKLAEAYKGRDCDVYKNLLTKYQQQLVKCAEIQHLNDYYEGERNYHLGKRKGVGGQYIV